MPLTGTCKFELFWFPGLLGVPLILESKGTRLFLVFLLAPAIGVLLLFSAFWSNMFTEPVALLFDLTKF